jgi:predicted acyltransferase
MRLKSLDVFRGIAIAAMVLVNNPGSWDYVYPVLEHAKWHGCTPTDLIFPFFLFIVGAAMPFSLSSYLATNFQGRSSLAASRIYGKIFKRAFILFLLGLGLNLYSAIATQGDLFLANLRIMGVLQRIALAYLIGAIAILNLSKKQLYLCSGLILIAYWLLMQFIPVPGGVAGDLSEAGNWGAYIDRLILTEPHLLKGGPFDPEGLLGTLPATVTLFIGYFTGDWLKNRPIDAGNSINLVMAGLCLIIIGYAWGLIFPLNKPLWTSSYVIYTGGWALLTLAACYELVEVRQQQWLWPLEIMGLNAIFLFVGSGLVARLMLFTKIGTGENTVSIKTWLYENIFQYLGGPTNGSLIFALVNLGIWWLILYFMYRRQWFFKV